MEESAPLVIRGSGGTTLEVAFAHGTQEEATFTVTLRSGWLSASTLMTTYHYGPPTDFFAELASSWRGWQGEKKWEEIEGRVKFIATSNRTGHIHLEVSLRPHPALAGRVTDVIELEAGTLHALSTTVRKYFQSHAI
jgi:hypothetical protein